MRTLMLASAAILGLAGVARAQTADSGPMSTKATNTDASTTKNPISPRLPGSAADSTPDQFLMRAKMAVSAGKTGEAQQALEQAETRLLDRSTLPANASMPDPSPRIAHISMALKALAPLKRDTAQTEIAAAMSPNGSDAQTYGSGS